MGPPKKRIEEGAIEENLEQKSNQFIKKDRRPEGKDRRKTGRPVTAESDWRADVRLRITSRRE